MIELCLERGIFIEIFCLFVIYDIPKFFIPCRISSDLIFIYHVDPGSREELEIRTEV